MKLDSDFIPYTKINLKLIVELKIKAKVIKLLKESIK